MKQNIYRTLEEVVQCLVLHIMQYVLTMTFVLTAIKCSWYIYFQFKYYFWKRLLAMTCAETFFLRRDYSFSASQRCYANICSTLSSLVSRASQHCYIMHAPLTYGICTAKAEISRARLYVIWLRMFHINKHSVLHPRLLGHMRIHWRNAERSRQWENICLLIDWFERIFSHSK